MVTRFESSETELAYGSWNFENFHSITRAHKSRDALSSRPNILILLIQLLETFSAV